MIAIISGPGITVTNNSLQPYVSPMAKHGGVVHFNSQTLELEIYDGSNWNPIRYSYQVEVDMDVKEVVRWAKEKMLEEAQLKERLKKYSALQQAHEQFKIIDILTQEQEKNGAR